MCFKNIFLIIILLLNVFEILPIVIFNSKVKRFIGYNFIDKKSDYYKLYLNRFGEILGCEDFFILLEVSKNSSENYSSVEYYQNEKFISDISMLSDGNAYEFMFEVDLSAQSPKYKMKIFNLTVNNKTITNRYEINLVGDKLEFFSIALLKSDYEKGKKKKLFSFRLKKVREIVKNLSEDGYYQINKKWGLFKLKVRGESNVIYCFSNDVESSYNMVRMFGDNITDLEVVKCNTEKIEQFQFFCCCDNLCKANLSNFKINDDYKIYFSSMFHGCKKLKSVILPKNDGRPRNIVLHGTFNNCTNLVDVNFHDLNLKFIQNKYPIFGGCKNLKYIKFPKTKIVRENYDKDNRSEIFGDCKIGEVDMSDVTFEEGTGDYMFEGAVIDKLVLNENIKHLGDKRLDLMFKNNKIRTCKIGKNEIVLKPSDNIVDFIKDPDKYGNKKENIVKDKSEKKQRDNDKVNKNIMDLKDKGFPCCECCKCCLR